MTDLRICFLGDSFTVGVGDPTGLGWVGRVARATRERGVSVTGYNLGVRLDTSHDVRARWRREIDCRLRHGDDHRIVLSVGVNDTTLIDNDRVRVAPDQTLAHVRAILGDAGAAGWSPLLVGVPPVLDRAHTERIASLTQELDRTCRELSLPHAPVLDALMSYPPWFEEIRAGDEAHPSERGYDRLAAIILEGGWWQWLEEPPRDGGP